MKDRITTSDEGGAHVQGLLHPSPDDLRSTWYRRRTKVTATSDPCQAPETIPKRPHHPMRTARKAEIDAVNATYSQIGTAHVGPTQISMRQVRVAKLSVPQIGSLEVRLRQIGSMQVGLLQIRACQVSPTQIGVLKVRALKASILEINIREARTL